MPHVSTARKKHERGNEKLFTVLVAKFYYITVLTSLRNLRAMKKKHLNRSN